MSGTGNDAAPFVGIDVSKARMDVGIWPSGETFGESNDDPGRKRIAVRLTDLKPQLVVLESTGHLAMPMALELNEHNVPFRIVDPRPATEFARSIGQLATAGRIDAVMLARWAENAGLEPTGLPNADLREFSALVERRLQLVEIRSTEQDRLDGGQGEDVGNSLKASIAWLDREIASLDRRRDYAMKGHPELMDVDAEVRPIPGVGPNSGQVIAPSLMTRFGTWARRWISDQVKDAVKPLLRLVRRAIATQQMDSKLDRLLELFDMLSRLSELSEAIELRLALLDLTVQTHLIREEERASAISELRAMAAAIGPRQSAIQANLEGPSLLRKDPPNLAKTEKMG